MIGLNESLEAAAEVPFYLPSAADPLVGLTGHVFTPGQVKIRLPGAGSYVDVALNKIREVGLGWYAARLTAVQTTASGSVLIDANVGAIAQPWRGSEVIGTRGGEFGVGGTGYLYFYLPQAADPIYGAPVTGYVFDNDDVKVAWPDLAFANVAGSTVVEFGSGFYGVPVTSANTAVRGKAYVHAEAVGAQRFSSYVTILNAQEISASASEPGPDPVQTETAAVQVEFVDHFQEAINRLCQYAKAKL